MHRQQQIPQTVIPHSGRRVVYSAHQIAMLKASLMTIVVLVLGTILLGLFKMFHICALQQHHHPLAPQLRVPDQMHHVDSHENLVFSTFADLSLCDGSVYHCPLVSTCVSQYSLAYLNYCTYQGRAAVLLKDDDFFHAEVDRKRETEAFVSVYRFPSNESLTLLDGSSPEFAQNLDAMRLNKRGVICVTGDRRTAEMARSLGYIVFPGGTTTTAVYLLAGDLLELGYTVVHAYGFIPERSPVNACKDCDLIVYRDSHRVYMPTDRVKFFFAVFAFASQRLQSAAPNNLFDVMSSKMQLVVLAFPPPKQFAKLALCDGTGYYYSCTDNPTCDSGDKCHHKRVDVVLEDTQVWRQFWVQRTTREDLWRGILHRMETQLQHLNPKRRLIVMSFNIGFAHLFSNWVCSLERNGVNVEYIKQHMLIVATDQLAIDYVTSLGFFAPTLLEVEALRDWTNIDHIQSTPASYFGSGAHKKINLMLKFSLPLDLLNLGYSILIQDVDLVWTKNVFDLMHDVYCPEGEECDVAFLHEKRPFVSWEDAPHISWLRINNQTGKEYYTDDRSNDDADTHPALYPEVNTGMFLIRPTPKMIELMEVLLESSRLQQWYSRDQILWNSLLYNKFAPQVKFKLLPAHVFLPGKFIRPSYIAASHPVPTTEHGLAAIHASDTEGFRSKFHRLLDIGHWYFDHQCGLPYEACEAIESCFKPFKASLAFCRKTDVDCLAREAIALAEGAAPAAS